ncbi:MAG: peptide ABC transporter substrate-binding protein [Opitutales bacterium]
MRLPSPNALLFCAGFVCTLLLAGCGRPETNVERGNRNQELYLGLGADPAALDPHLVSGVTENYVLLALLEGLVTRHPETLEIEPGVARDWDVSEDLRRYTFHFDPEARWSNGDRVRPEDFVFSFKRILHPELGAPYASMLYPMRGAKAFNKGDITDFKKVGVRAPDSRTLVIELEEPTPFFLGLLTHFTWWPVHPPTILKHGSMTDRISNWTKPGNFVGNGPFTLESWQLNAAVEVRKSSSYRDTEDVELNAIHFLPVKDDTEERAFRAGYIHIASTVPTHRIEWYRENRPENIRFDDYLGTYYYALNTRRPPLDDPRIRKALAYSINRGELTEHILLGGQKPAYNFTPPGTGGYEPEPQFRYDPERARALLAAAGFPEGRGLPTLELLYNTSESHRSIALAIQQMWRSELGIDVRLLNQEWKAYLSTRQERNFDILRAGWIGDYDDPSTFLELILPDNGNNHSGWEDPEYERILKTAARTPAGTERKRLFARAEARLMEAMPVIPIYFYVRSLLIDEAVRGWSSNILDYHPYTDISLREPETR